MTEPITDEELGLLADGTHSPPQMRRIKARAEPVTDDELARRFHIAYENLAPAFGYSTRPESSGPWESVPEDNRRLMEAVVHEVVRPLLDLERNRADEAVRKADAAYDDLSKERDAAEAEVERLREALERVMVETGTSSLAHHAARDALASKPKEPSE